MEHRTEHDTAQHIDFHPGYLTIEAVEHDNPNVRWIEPSEMEDK